jgi:hypothetical protein
MRVAVIVVVLFAGTTSLQASQSCMNKGEARKHFSTSHIYWHGPDHCWDATPPHHGIHGVRRNTSSHQAERKRHRPEHTDQDQAQLDEQSKPDRPKADRSNADRPKPDRSTPDQVKSDQSKWRDSMSAMLLDAGQALLATRDARPDRTDNAATAAPASDGDGNAESSPLTSRWVDIVQVTPQPIIEPKPEPSGTPHGMVLLLIAFVFTMGTVMVLFHVVVLQRPGSTTRA